MLLIVYQSTVVLEVLISDGVLKELKRNEEEEEEVDDE